MLHLNHMVPTLGGPLLTAKTQSVWTWATNAAYLAIRLHARHDDDRAPLQLAKAVVSPTNTAPELAQNLSEFGCA